MRALWLLVAGCWINASVAGSLYKHVDAQGNVTYTDRPQQPGQAALSLPPVNVTTPEARRQLDLARQRWQQEEQLEWQARMQQWSAANRGAPVGYSRPAAMTSVPRYAGRSYTPNYYYPTFYTFTTPAPNAGTPTQPTSSERHHRSGESHRAHRARR